MNKTKKKLCGNGKRAGTRTLKRKRQDAASPKKPRKRVRKPLSSRANWVADALAWAKAENKKSFARWLLDQPPSMLAQLETATSFRTVYERHLAMKRRAAAELREADAAALAETGTRGLSPEARELVAKTARFWRRLEKCGMAEATLAELNSTRAFWRFPPLSADDAAAGVIPFKMLRASFRAAAYNRAYQDLGVLRRSGGTPRSVLDRAHELIEKGEGTTDR